MKVKSESDVAQLCLTLSNPMDCSLPGSSIHGIFQARVLEWGAIAFSGSCHVNVLIYSLERYRTSLEGLERTHPLITEEISAQHTIEESSTADSPLLIV